MEAEEQGRNEEEGDRDGETPRGAPVEVARVGGDVPPPEENTDLPGFLPERVHLLLQEVYEDLPHHNDRAQLDGRIADDAVWQRCWLWLAAQSAI